MTKSIINKPVHPLIMAAYPILALFAVNVREVEAGVILRPVIISIFFAFVVLLIIQIIIKNWSRSALITSFVLILFFSYGHLYSALKSVNLFDLNLGRHRFLIPIYVLGLILGLWVILRKVIDFTSVNAMVNLISFFLIILPVSQISYQAVRDWSDQRGVKSLESPISISTILSGDTLPDIYYIVLDAYTRADALQIDFMFDNSPFLDELNSIGFYIAACSRTNYSYTLGALTSTLNLNYLPTLISELKNEGVGERGIWALMKQSRVRSHLESIGYKTVAFATGYDWSQLTDADVYISVERGPFSRVQLHPFEFLLIKSTALLLIADVQSFSKHIDNADFRHGTHITLQRFILEQLPKAALIPGPKFVFAHILIPHVPFVFKADGEIQTDPGYFDSNHAMPIDEHYLREGYIGQIQFINTEILRIIPEILAASPTPPIIIIHGDHGWSGENRLSILNAYYLPEPGQANLYPSISPVNTFRIILDTYFGTEFGLLPDYSFLEGDLANAVPETSNSCTQ